MGLKVKGIGMLSVLILLTFMVIPVMAKGGSAPPIRNPAPVDSPGVGRTEFMVLILIILVLSLLT